MLHLYQAPLFGARSNGFPLRKSFFFGFIMLVSVIAARAESPEPALTLTTALQQALDLNPSLRVYPFRDEALAGSALTANLRPAVEVGFEAENFAGSGELEGFDNAELTVSLFSVLELGEKRSARGGVISDSRTVLETQRQLESLELLAEVTRRFIDTLASQARVELAGEAVALAEQTLSVVNKRTAAGASPQAEAKRAQAALAMARLMESSERKRFEFLKVSLSALWGVTTPSFLRVDGDLFQFGDDVAFETLYERVSNNPAVQLFAAQERVKEAELRLVKTQSTSDISWSVGVRRLREVDDTALVAGLSMPLFSGRRNSGEIRRAMAERNAISVEREASVLQLHSLLFSAYSSRQQARMAVEQLKQAVIPALEDAANQTRLGYQRGRFGYLDYITASQELLESKRMLIESAAAVLTYGAEIEQLTADTVSVEQFTPNTAISGYPK
jgi:cobalt-zinc-cadmium efflux system outer membrane protein